MLLVLFREHIQQHGVRFTYVHVQTYAVHLAKRYVLQPLVEHTDTVLLALNGFANDVRHAAGTDRQLLFTVGQLFGQTAKLDLHLFDSFHRIIGTNNILTNTFTQMLINRHEELNFTFRTFWIFRHPQHVAQMFVIRHRQTQRT